MSFAHHSYIPVHGASYIHESFSQLKCSLFQWKTLHHTLTHTYIIHERQRENYNLGTAGTALAVPVV